MSETRRWVAFTAAAAIAVLAAGWFLLVAPQRSKVSELKTQDQAAQQSNAALVARLAQLKTQATDLPAVNARIAQLDQRIPDSPREPALIRSLTVAAKNAGVTLQSIVPQPMVPYEAPVSTGAVVPAPVATSPATDATPATTAPVTAAPSLQVIPISLTVSGDYTGAKLFVAGLEKLQRSFLVTNFDLTSANDTAAGEVSGGASTGAASNGDISLNLTGNVFVASAAAPAASAPVVAAPAATATPDPSTTASAN